MTTLTAPATTAVDRPARFAWCVPTDTWRWSPECFGLHGYAECEVEPSTALFLSHRHRDDLYGYVDAMHEAARCAGVAVCEHRLIDVHGTVRPVVLLARSFTGESREIDAVVGYLLPVPPDSQSADDWQLSVVQVALGLSRPAAAAVLQWRRRQAAGCTECLTRIAGTLLMTSRESAVRAQFDEEFLDVKLFAPGREPEGDRHATGRS